MNAPPKAAAPPCPGEEGGVTEIKGCVQKNLLDKPLSPEVQDILSRAQQREDEERFDWNADDSVTVRSQPATAVYTNKFGQVVIRQEREWNEDEDTFVYVSRENVLAIVRAMLEDAGFENAHLYEQRPGGCCYDIGWPEPFPATAREAVLQAVNPHIDMKAVAQDFDEADKLKPKDPTAAERQRRRRRKQRDASRDTVTVTPDRHDLKGKEAEAWELTF